MSELLLFKNVSFRQGDILRLAPTQGKTSLPDGAEVAAIGIHDAGHLIVFHKQQLISIPPDHLEGLLVIEEAEEAIPKQSGGQQFQQHQRLSCKAAGIRYTGQAIAAIDGMVVIAVGDHLVTGLAKDFIPIRVSLVE